MGIRQKIHDKLITDFSAFQFEGGNTMFGNVKKYYAANSMNPLDCLIIPDTLQENTSGLSAGNFQTTRQYAFRAVVLEDIEATDSDATGALKYSRLANVEDEILDYIQKEPSNLNSWGSTNGIAIYKMRVTNGRYETVQTESGYAVMLDILFVVYLNVIPQNL